MLAKEGGADHVILDAEQDFEEEINRLAGPNTLDVILDAVGKTTFAKGLNLLRPWGLMVLYGAANGPFPPLDLRDLSYKGSLYVTLPMLSQHTLTREELEWRAGDLMSWVNGGQHGRRHPQASWPA